jgi:hypothetical protein
MDKTKAHGIAGGPGVFRTTAESADGYLVNQLAGNGQSIDNLAFITSLVSGNLELLARGGAGTFLKLNHLDGGAVAEGALKFKGSSGTVTTIAPG